MSGSAHPSTVLPETGTALTGTASPLARTAAPLAQATPTPGIGVDEVVDLWPIAIRAWWFLLGFLVVVSIGWFVVVPVVARGVRHRNPNNSTLREAVVRYLRLFVVLVGVLVGATTAGYGRVIGDSALVVAAATLALGVAGQTVIGSLVSGLVLVADPEFNVGDYIVWDEGEGTVQSITLRVTRVLTPDGEFVTVPNTVLTDRAISRPYGRGRYRIVDRIDLAFDADVDVATRCIHDAIGDVDRIADAPSPRVYVEGFGDDTVTMAAHYWVARPKHADIQAAQSAFARGVKDRLTEAEVEVSPPSTRELEGRIDVRTVEGAGTDGGHRPH